MQENIVKLVWMLCGRSCAHSCQIMAIVQFSSGQTRSFPTHQSTSSKAFPIKPTYWHSFSTNQLPNSTSMSTFNSQPYFNTQRILQSKVPSSYHNQTIYKYLSSISYSSPLWPSAIILFFQPKPQTLLPNYPKCYDQLWPSSSRFHSLLTSNHRCSQVFPQPLLSLALHSVSWRVPFTKNLTARKNWSSRLLQKSESPQKLEKS